MQKATYEAYLKLGNRCLLQADTFQEAAHRFETEYNYTGLIMLCAECPNCGSKIGWNMKDYPQHIIHCQGCKHLFKVCTDYERKFCDICTERIECLTHKPL